MSLLDLVGKFQAKAAENPFIKSIQTGLQQTELARQSTRRYEPAKNLGSVAKSYGQEWAKSISPLGTAVGNILVSPFEIARLKRESQTASSLQNKHPLYAANLNRNISNQYSGIANKMKAAPKQALGGAIGAGLTYLGAGNPGATAFGTALGGALNTGFSALTNKYGDTNYNLYESLGTGMGGGFKYAGLNSVTGPIFDPIIEASGLGKNILPRLISRAFSSGVLNIAEDTAFNALVEGRGTSEDEMVMSFLMGSIMAPLSKYDPNNSFYKIQDDGKLKVDKKYIRNKLGQFAKQNGLDPNKIEQKAVEWVGKLNEDTTIRIMRGDKLVEEIVPKWRALIQEQPLGMGIKNVNEGIVNNKYPGFVEGSSERAGFSKPTRDINELRNIKPSTYEPQAQLLADKYGIDPGFLQKLGKNYNYAQIERAIAYVNESSVPVKSKEGYIVSALKSDFFTKEPTKIKSAEPPMPTDADFKSGFIKQETPDLNLKEEKEWFEQAGKDLKTIQPETKPFDLKVGEDNYVDELEETLIRISPKPENMTDSDLIKLRGWTSEEIKQGYIKNIDGKSYNQLKEIGYTDKELQYYIKNEKLPNGKSIYDDYMERSGDPGSQVIDNKIVDVSKKKPETIKIKESAPAIKTKNTRILSEKEFTSLPDKKTQVAYTRKLQQTLHNFFDDVVEKMNRDGVSTADFIDDLKNNGTKYPELASMHKKAVESFADYIKEIDPDWNPRNDGIYYPHMKEISDSDIMKEVEEGLWISQLDLESGNIVKSRTGEMKDYSLDYRNVMKNYTDQFLTYKFLNNLKGETPLQSTVIDYSKQIAKEIKSNSALAKKTSIPDFVKEGNKSGNIKQQTDLKLNDIEEQFRGRNNVFKRIGGDLYNRWASLRDVSRKMQKITPDMTPGQINLANKMNAKAYKQTLQAFVDTAGQVEIKDLRLRNYVNEVIANYTSKRLLERSLADNVFDTISQTFSRAHLWFSATTGGKQLLETTKLPAWYNPKTITKGMANLGDGKRIFNNYDLGDFSDPFEFNTFKKQLRTSVSKKSVSQTKNAVVDVADKIGYSAINAGESAKNIIYAAVAEQKGIEKGYEVGSAKMYRFVREALYEQANVATAFNRAKFFDKAINRLLFQYSQFGVKNARQVSDAISEKDLSKASKLFGSQLLNLGAVMAVTGLPAIYAIQQLLPISTGPLFSFTQRAIELLTSKYTDETKKQKLTKLVQQNLQPGGAQTVRSTEGLSASRGYDVDARGNVKYYGEKEGLVNTIRAFLFGSNSLSSVRDYYKENKRPFGKSDSQIFQSLSGTEQNQYAETIMSDREQNKKITDIKDSLENGDEIQGVEKASFIMDGEEQDGYVIGDKFVYRKDGENHTKTIANIERQQVKDEKALVGSEYSLITDRFKREDNVEGWIEVTQNYVDYLKDYKTKLNKKTDAKELIDVQNKIEDLEASLEKYQGYGGFTKPKAAKKISVSKPKRTALKLKKAPKLNFGDIPKMPTLNFTAPKAAIRMPKVQAYTPKAEIKSKVRWL